MKRMRGIAPIAVAGMAGLLFAGCTTKNYVRKQTTPLIDHVNQLDAQTAQQTNNIKTEDQKIQQGLSAVNQRSSQAMSAAQQANAAAQQVGSQLNQQSSQISSLSNTLANLDNYQLNYQAAVHFAFNRFNLTSSSRDVIRDVASRLQQNPHTIIEVVGYTDSTGPQSYNYRLSQWRADSVVNFLEANNIPPHRIFLIGLGKNQYVASNRTARGRRENRRVELRLMANSLAQPAGSAAAASSTPAGQAAQPQAAQPGVPQQPNVPQQ